MKASGETGRPGKGRSGGRRGPPGEVDPRDIVHDKREQAAHLRALVSEGRKAARGDVSPARKERKLRVLDRFEKDAGEIEREADEMEAAL